MTARDLHSITKKQFIFDIIQINSNGSLLGGISFDTAGSQSVEVYIFTADDSTDGDHALIIRHGDSEVAATHGTVPQEDLIGPNLEIVGTNSLDSQGYIGKKRFISAEVITSDLTTFGRVGVLVVSDHLRHSETD